MDKLDELKMMSGRHEQVTLSDVFEARKSLTQEDEEESIEKELESVVFHNSTDHVKKLSEDDAIKPIPITKTISKALPKKKKTNSALRVVPKDSDDLSSLIGSY